MRGHDEQTHHMFSYLSPEQRVPADSSAPRGPRADGSRAEDDVAQVRRPVRQDGTSVDPA